MLTGAGDEMVRINCDVMLLMSVFTKRWIRRLDFIHKGHALLECDGVIFLWSVFVIQLIKHSNPFSRGLYGVISRLGNWQHVFEDQL